MAALRFEFQYFRMLSVLLVMYLYFTGTTQNDGQVQTCWVFSNIACRIPVPFRLGFLDKVPMYWLCLHSIFSSHLDEFSVFLNLSYI